MILICKNIRFALWDVKKRFCDKKIQICFVIYKKKLIFDDKNLDLFYYIYIFLKYFLRRELHS